MDGAILNRYLIVYQISKEEKKLLVVMVEQALLMMDYKLVQPFNTVTAKYINTNIYFNAETFIIIFITLGSIANLYQK